MHYLILRYSCLLMFESNNVNISQIKMTSDFFKKYKFRTMFLLKSQTYNISEMHLRIHPINIPKCISGLIFGKNGICCVQICISKNTLGHFWVFRGATHTISVGKEIDFFPKHGQHCLYFFHKNKL